MGLTVTRPVQDPLAVTPLENRLCICEYYQRVIFGGTTVYQIKTFVISQNLVTSFLILNFQFEYRDTAVDEVLPRPEDDDDDKYKKKKSNENLSTW